MWSMCVGCWSALPFLSRFQFLLLSVRAHQNSLDELEEPFKGRPLHLLRFLCLRRRQSEPQERPRLRILHTIARHLEMSTRLCKQCMQPADKLRRTHNKMHSLKFPAKKKKRRKI